MSDLYDPYDYSTEFNYAMWGENTVVTLTNVPWDSAYRDVVPFASEAELNAYIDANSTSVDIEDMTYVRPNTPVTIPLSINNSMNYNYLRVTNEAVPGMNDVPRAYYYFINNVEFASPSATRMMLQLDLFQTYYRRTTINNSYIERGHVGIANEDAFDQFGRAYLTVPEGLDIGGEYVHALKRTQTIMSGTAAFGTNNEIDILVCSTIDLEVEPGTVKSPRLYSAKGDNLQGMPSGASFYVFQTVEAFKIFMEVYADKPWITQGIVSVTAIPSIERYGYKYVPVEMDNPRIQMFRVDAKGGHGKYYELFPDWRTEARNALPERYRMLDKMLVSPYSMVELTTYSGTPILMKPESWQSRDGEVAEKAVLVPPAQRVTVSPQYYNSPAGARAETRLNDDWTDQYDDNGEYLDLFTVISNFPTFAIVNNAAVGYLASNRNSLAFQQQSADWSQQRALAGNQTAYGQASAGMENTFEQGRIARGSDMASTQINSDAAAMRSLMGGAGALSGGLMSGNPLGVVGGSAAAAMTGASYAVEQSVMQQQLSNRQVSAVASQNSSLNNATYNRDTNKDYADFATRGDYAQAIAGINAKTQDARLTQPSTSGQAGGEAFNMIHGSAVVSMRVKMMSPDALAVLGEYWLRYGYAVRRFGSVPRNLHVMSHFTYWKLTETYLTGNIPEQFKVALRGILEKGVTAWVKPEYIGRIDMSVNKPLEGVKL